MSESSSLDKIRSFYSHDRFATDACKCSILEARPDHAVCTFTIEPVHLNARGAVMGGAIFTLADFALAVASNVGGTPSVSVSNTIEYLSTARGTRLIATCDAEKSGRNLGFYTVNVQDELGTSVARMCATCYRIQSAQHTATHDKERHG